METELAIEGEANGRAVGAVLAMRAIAQALIDRMPEDEARAFVDAAYLEANRFLDMERGNMGAQAQAAARDSVANIFGNLSRRGPR
jgi:hypothetical protein